MPAKCHQTFVWTCLGLGERRFQPLRSRDLHPRSSIGPAPTSKACKVLQTGELSHSLKACLSVFLFKCTDCVKAAVSHAGEAAVPVRRRKCLSCDCRAHNRGVNCVSLSLSLVVWVVMGCIFAEPGCSLCAKSLKPSVLTAVLHRQLLVVSKVFLLN